jgi:alkylation response protein AidB-like acyl-CoA dehydrogenase
VVDENDRFVAENYEALKQSGLVEAGVPRELGGGGADVAELERSQLDAARLELATHRARLGEVEQELLHVQRAALASERPSLTRSCAGLPMTV